MLPEPGQEPHGKVVNGHQRLVEAGIHATHHQLIEQISVAGRVNTRTDSNINITAII